MMKKYFNQGWTLLFSFLILASLAHTFLYTTTIRNVTPLYIMIAIFLILFQFKRLLWLRIIALFMILSWTLYTYFPKELLYPFPWMSQFLSKTTDALSRLIGLRALAFTNELAFLLISLMLLIFAYLLIRRHQWKPIFFVTLVYYCALIAINRSNLTMAFFQLLVFSFAYAYGQQSQFSVSSMQFKSLLIVVCVFALITSSWYIPSVFSDYHNQLIDATINLRNDLSEKGFYTALEASRNTGISGVSGYSEVDSVLGGPSYRNELPVFQARQSQSHLWRIESKEIYTGRGWESEASAGSRIDLELETIDVLNENYAEDTYSIEFITSTDNITYLPLPYGRVNFEINNDDYSLANIRYNDALSRVTINETNENDLLAYNITYQKPSFTSADLEQVAYPAYSDEFAMYLQLPASLPDRIKSLAYEITKDETTYYGKVKAIENYLKSSGDYRYSLSDALIAPNGSDYVDYFLFDSQVGYCEHFSSAMVVLLRTLGYPTRWAKGYAPGKIIQSYTDSTSLYLVTNADAHTWPEVYFHGVGWVPFEPTPSFSSQITTVTTNPTNPTNPTDPTTPVTPTNPSDPTNPTTPTDPQEELPTNNTDTVSFNWVYPVAISGVGLSVLLAGLYLWQRRNILHWLWLKAVKDRSKSFVTLYIHMINDIAYYIPREPHQTIQIYVQHLIHLMPDLEEPLLTLTGVYHRTVFSQLDDHQPTEDDGMAFLMVDDIVHTYQKKKK